MKKETYRQVQAYQTRSTSLPSEIVSTSLITQALLIPPSSPPLVFRTSMTLALIRFVNSLLDPLQKRDKSLPLTVLAADAGLPSAFVEVRHWGTHENNLPSTEVLKSMGIRALEWLWRNYWNKKVEIVDVVALWKSNKVDAGQVTENFERKPEESFERLFVALGDDEDFAASKKLWDSLVSILVERLSNFPEIFVDYMVETLSTIPNCEALSFNF